MGGERIERDRDARIDYLQFARPRWLRFAMAAIGALTWPVVLPLALLARVSDGVFRSLSETLALLPYAMGVIVRREFYRFTLTSCGSNVIVEFGAVFIYRDVRVGSNVLIGRYSIVHHCDFGNYVVIGERCTFLSGARYHDFARTDIPIALQGGSKRRIRIADDCWIGAHAVVMCDVDGGSVVAAGAVVTRTVPTLTVAAGVPAKTIARRHMTNDD